MSGARPPAVRIVVDVHERQSGIPDVLAEELGAEVEIVLLPAGDYAVGADTLVERKRVLDLHAAVIKGRLWPQLAKLRAADRTAVDVGALDEQIRERGGAAIRGVCLAAIDQGIALLRSGQPRDSALWIHRLAVRCQRIEPAASRPVYSQRPKAHGGPEAAEALLAAVPGISATSARALLARFGSVAAVLAVGPEEWLSVPGIGPERARALAETLHHPFGGE